MHLPTRIPLHLLPALADIELERPMIDQVELITLLEANEFLDGISWNEDTIDGHSVAVVLPRAPNVRLSARDELE